MFLGSQIQHRFLLLRPLQLLFARRTFRSLPQNGDQRLRWLTRPPNLRPRSPWLLPLLGPEPPGHQVDPTGHHLPYPVHDGKRDDGAVSSGAVLLRGEAGRGESGQVERGGQEGSTSD